MWDKDTQRERLLELSNIINEAAVEMKKQPLLNHSTIQYKTTVL